MTFIQTVAIGWAHIGRELRKLEYNLSKTDKLNWDMCEYEDELKYVIIYDKEYYFNLAKKIARYYCLIDPKYKPTILLGFGVGEVLMQACVSIKEDYEVNYNFKKLPNQYIPLDLIAHILANSFITELEIIKLNN